jgi:hypothetical protein
MYDGSSTVIASEAKQSRVTKSDWIASSRSLSSGARPRDPLAPRNDGSQHIAWGKCVTDIFDFVVVGGSSHGCAVASRLSEDPQT